MSRSRLAVAAGALLLALAVGSARGPDVEAHSLLVRSDPPINAALRESPQAMNLFFSEPLQRDFSSIEVLDSTGMRVDFGEVSFNPEDATNMTTRVPRLGAGVYTVVWRTLSQVDGHTWNGSYAFTVLNPDGSAPGGAAFEADVSTPGPPAGADAAARWVSFVALVALVGGLLFARLAASPAANAAGDAANAFARTARDHGWDFAAAAVVALLATTAYDAVSGGLQLGGAEFIDEFLFDTRTGLWLLVRWGLLLAAAVLVALAQWRPAARASREAAGVGVVLGLGLIASFSGISHGAAIDRGDIWGTLFDAMHLAGVAVWVGMLGAMLWTFWSIREAGDAQARRRFRVEAVRRFSWAALVSVPILATAGLLSILIQTPAWRGFTDTDWGVAMLVKLAALAALFAVAATNAIVLRPRQEQAAQEAPGAAWSGERRFARLMRAELGLMLVVLAATAAMTQLSTPRSELPATADQKDNTIVRAVAMDDLVAQVRIEPNLVGVNRYVVDLRDADGGPPSDAVREVRLHFRFEDPAVGPVIIPATPENEDGSRFELEGAFFGLAGRWTVEVEVRRETRDDAIGSIETDVEQPFLAVLPFGQDAPGALALPITQFDWNGVGALWAAVAAGMLVVLRSTLRDRLSRVAGDAALAGGTVSLAVAVALVVGVHTHPGRAVTNPTEATAASVASGAALFGTNCAACHGTAGLGDGPLAGTLPAPPANFRVHVPFHPDGVLFTWISNGIRGTGMPAWKDALSEQERWDLVNFLRASFDEPIEASGS